jgi:lipoate-protein ligase A
VWFVENPNTDPYRNHALEEWLMERTDEDCFMLWQNKKAILLGRNQNAYSEINLPYAKKQAIHIVRRITGGGTVFTDEGNVMFTFISCKGAGDFANFRKYTIPILSGLRKMGIPAEFSGRNDLTVAGKKFSGNAQCRYGGKVLHHGTLMYKADTGELARALNVRDIKLQGKGVRSVRARVTNLCEYLPLPMETRQFRDTLFRHVLEETPGAKLFSLSGADWADVAQKALEKHATPAWIYGRAPRFNIRRETRLPGGIVEVFFDVENGTVTQARIFGDFFGDGEIGEIEAAVTGVLYEETALREALAPYAIKEYFRGISPDELLRALV